MRLKGCSILNADFRLEKKDLCLENGRIVFSGGAGEELDLTGMTVIPGLVDIHMHGYMGEATSSADRAGLIRMSCALLRAGTTSFLPTVGSGKPETLGTALSRLRELIEGGTEGGADMLGIYLESPYISPAACGAIQPSIVRPFDRAEFDRYFALSGESIRIVTLAPEIKENFDAIPYLTSRGITVAIGHTTADADTAGEAIRAGASHATHLFNAMRGLAHREPGTVGAILDSHATAELIADGHHIDPCVIRLAHRLLGAERTVLVSDLSNLGGCPDGEYYSPDADRTVIIRGGTARLPSGTLSGNVSPLFTLVRRAVSFGIPFPDAVRAATLNPARLAGADGRKGSIAEGKDADLLVLDSALELRYVIKNGKLCTPA